VGTFAALALAPASLAARPLTVGYMSPAALSGLHIVVQVAPLQIAEVDGTTPGALRKRPGIRWVQTTEARHHLGTASPATQTVANAEWEFAATRSNLVPGNVLRAAENITIAVVDTGADLTAPAIAAKDPITYNAVTNTPTVSDSTGHGTFVASVAGGSDIVGSELRGFAGDAKLMIVQANADANTFDDVDEAAGIVWAVDHGANIINLSIGGADTSQVEKDAVDYAVAHNVLLVAAAGNTGTSGNVLSYPAALVGSDGLAVAATTSRGTRAPFSTVASYVSIAAPGVHVLGATTAAASRADYPRATLPSAQGSYAFGTGTSYASPQVAGAAALVWAAEPALTAPQVAALIERTASGNGSWNSATGYGVLDVVAAVDRALGVPAPSQTRSIAAPRPRNRSSIRS
jgi:subtilisin family serine protease